MRSICILLLTLLISPTWAADVPKAYPIHYELDRVTDNGQSVLAKGQAVLVPGHAQPLSQQQAPAPAAGDQSDQVKLHFTLERTLNKEPGAPPKLILNTEATVTKVTTVHKVEVPGKPNSYIRGPKSETVRYTNQSWRAAGDPTPIVLPFSRNGERYELTVMFVDQETR